VASCTQTAESCQPTDRGSHCEACGLWFSKSSRACVAAQAPYPENEATYMHFGLTRARMIVSKLSVHLSKRNLPMNRGRRLREVHAGRLLKQLTKGRSTLGFRPVIFPRKASAAQELSHLEFALVERRAWGAGINALNHFFGGHRTSNGAKAIRSTVNLTPAIRGERWDALAMREAGCGDRTCAALKCFRKRDGSDGCLMAQSTLSLGADHC